LTSCRESAGRRPPMWSACRAVLGGPRHWKGGEGRSALPTFRQGCGRVCVPRFLRPLPLQTAGTLSADRLRDGRGLAGAWRCGTGISRCHAPPPGIVSMFRCLSSFLGCSMGVGDPVWLTPPHPIPFLGSKPDQSCRLPGERRAEPIHSRMSGGPNGGSDLARPTRCRLLASGRHPPRRASRLGAYVVCGRVHPQAPPGSLQTNATSAAFGAGGVPHADTGAGALPATRHRRDLAPSRDVAVCAILVPWRR
jgi:hypothetical protein